MRFWHGRYAGYRKHDLGENLSVRQDLKKKNKIFGVDTFHVKATSFIYPTPPGGVP